MILVFKLNANDMDFQSSPIDSKIPITKTKAVKYFLSRGEKSVSPYEWRDRKENFEFVSSKLRISKNYEELKYGSELLYYATQMSNLLPNPFAYRPISLEFSDEKFMPYLSVIEKICVKFNEINPNCIDILRFMPEANMSFNLRNNPQEIESNNLSSVPEYASMILDCVEYICGATPCEKISDYGYMRYGLKDFQYVQTIHNVVNNYYNGYNVNFSVLSRSLQEIASVMTNYKTNFSLADMANINASVNYIKNMGDWDELTKLGNLVHYAEKVLKTLKIREYI